MIRYYIPWQRALKTKWIYKRWLRSRLFCHMTKTQNFNLDTKTLKKEINFFRPDSTVAAVPKIYTTATFFFSFLIWRKKRFKVLTHEFDDAWLIFFSVTKIFRRNHSSLSMCFTSSLDFAQWAFEFEFPALEIPYSKFKKVVISKCFFAVSYTIFTQYFTLLSLLCAHLICTYYT